MQVVLEEGLDISNLPETLKKDFEKVNQLEGQFRLTRVLMEAVDLGELSPRKAPPCSFCNVKKQAEEMNETLFSYERIKPTKTLTKVILSTTTL